MSPRIGEMLLRQVRPIIRACLAKGAVRTVGSEDLEELESDGIAQAARMLESAELAGKDVKPNSVAYYAIQSLRSGRRFGYAGCTDAMAPSTQIAGRSAMMSMDAPLGVDDDDDEEITLHSALAAPGEDAGMSVARRLDWDAVMPALDDRLRVILAATVAGHGPGEIARRLEVSSPRACQLRASIGNFIQDAWRTNGISDATTPAAWRAGMRAASERRAARAEGAW